MWITIFSSDHSSRKSLSAGSVVPDHASGGKRLTGHVGIGEHLDHALTLGRWDVNIALRT